MTNDLFGSQPSETLGVLVKSGLQSGQSRFQLRFRADQNLLAELADAVFQAARKHKINE
jgi:hypothetical protein